MKKVLPKLSLTELEPIREPVAKILYEPEEQSQVFLFHLLSLDGSKQALVISDNASDAVSYVEFTFGARDVWRVADFNLIERIPACMVFIDGTKVSMPTKPINSMEQ